MELQIKKQALVTGGNRGIGFAIAQGLLTKGYDVIITARALDSAKQAAAELSGNVMPLELDVSDDRSITQAAKMVSQQVGTLDVLINNAGIYPDGSVDVLTVSREVLITAMDTNTFGMIQLVQALLPLLEKSQDARIINMSSSLGSLTGMSTGTPSYSLSKLAMNGVTILLADSLQSKGIAVNSISPGWVKTDMGGQSAPRSPEQGADTAIWLATEAPHKETGKFWHDRKAIAF